MTDVVDAGEEVVNGVEADVTLSEFSTSDDLSAELVVVAKEKMLADADLASGTDQTLPLIRVLT